MNENFKKFDQKNGHENVNDFFEWFKNLALDKAYTPDTPKIRILQFTTEYNQEDQPVAYAGLAGTIHPGSSLRTMENRDFKPGSRRLGLVTSVPLEKMEWRWLVTERGTPLSEEGMANIYTAAITAALNANLIQNEAANFLERQIYSHIVSERQDSRIYAMLESPLIKTKLSTEALFGYDKQMPHLF